MKLFLHPEHCNLTSLEILGSVGLLTLGVARAGAVESEGLEEQQGSEHEVAPLIFLRSCWATLSALHAGSQSFSPANIDS